MRYEAAVVIGVLGGCAFDASGGASGGASSSTSGATIDPGSSTSSVGDASSGSLAMDDTSATSVAPGTSTETTSGVVDDTSSDATTDASDESTGGKSSAWCDANDDDLAACYAFADLASGVLTDGSAVANHGTVAGVGIEAGPLGEAATFSADSQVSVPAHRATDLSSAITMELFVRIDEIPASGRAGVLDRDGQWSLFVFDDGRLRCGGPSYTYWDAPVLGQWLHVGCLIGDDHVRLYVNGVLVSEASAGTIATGDPDPLAIGDNSPAFDEPLIGAIGGLRIWSTTRSADELCEGAGDLCA